MMPVDETRRLVLVRHAKSDYPWGVDDHDRPLNDRGRRDAPLIGGWLDEHLRFPDGQPPHVLVSSARRAQLTWSLAAGALSGRWDGFEQVDEPRIYEASVAELQAIVAEQADDFHTVILVGHNPGLAGLIARLCVPDARAVEALVKFPTSSIAVLEHGGEPGAGWTACARPQQFRVVDFAVPRG